MKKILIHHCCAPCSPAVIDFFKKKFNILSFWFNPNIMPEAEHSKRKEAFDKYSGCLGNEVINGEKDYKDRWIWETKRQSESRCSLCYFLRISQAIAEAKKLGIKFFSTTLLASPYQKHEEIKRICADLAEKEKVNFEYQDFRPSFYEGKNEIKKKGLYMQKYCGCALSIAEAEKSKKKEK